MRMHYLFVSLFFVTLTSSANENRNCGQTDRQLTVTTAHAISALICNLHANNASEKLARVKENTLNFVHKWKVQVTDDSFVVDGVCSTALRVYDRTNIKPMVIHPGFKLKLVLPRYEDLCDPTFKGTLTENFVSQINNKSTLSEVAQDKIASSLASLNKRDVTVHFADLGSLNVETDERSGGRYLTHMGLGFNLISMFRSGMSGGSMNQGGSSEVNKMAIGASVMSYAQFFGYEKKSRFAPDFSRIAAVFQFNKATDPSLANRDLLSTSGLSEKELYIRQNGLTQAFDDPKLSLKYDGGTSAFFVRSNSADPSDIEVLGCTNYSYDSDQNLAQNMTINDCRMQIQRLKSF